MKKRVVVTGLGLVCSQGDNPFSAFQAWCNSQSGIQSHAAGETPHTLELSMARCDAFDPSKHIPRSKLATMDRASQLALSSACSAWQMAGLDALDDEQRQQAGVCWGTGNGGSHAIERSYRDLFIKGRSRISPLTVVLGMFNASASQVAMQLRLGGDCLTYSVACASSAVAIGEAYRKISAGHAHLVVAGGSEASMPYGPAKAWESLHVLASDAERPSAACRPFDSQRKGLVLGEGAACLVLEERDHAMSRGATILAEISGYACSSDHSHMTTPDRSGQVRALQHALRDAGLTAADIGYVNAHGTATQEGDPVEVHALLEVLGVHAATTPISSTKSMHGHLLGAAGALEALITIMALREKRIPPTAHTIEIDPACSGLAHVLGHSQAAPGIRHALSNSFAFGGTNAVLILSAA
jgi:3-oxoacyl-[acyl-carrier-protein] synthase II